MFKIKHSKKQVVQSKVITQNTSITQKSTHGSRRLKVYFLILSALLLCGACFVYLQNKNNTNNTSSSNNSLERSNVELEKANEYVLSGDSKKALSSARKALEANPDDLTAIETVAGLIKKDDPQAARLLYGHAMDVIVKTNMLNEGGGTTITYWSAATFAKDAGRVNLAKLYYQKVIDTAVPSDSYQQSLVLQSRAALEKL